MSTSLAHADPEQRKQIIAQMQSLEKEMAKLAPHPDRPQDKGPTLVRRDARAAMGDEHDAMLGMLATEAFMGSMMAGILPSALSNIQISDMMECYSEYLRDRHSTSNYELGQRGSISSGFNTHSTGMRKTLEDAYKADLPRRQKLEGAYANLSQKLDQADTPRAAQQMHMRPGQQAAPTPMAA